MGGTVTLMFTDLVGSTELLGRLGEDGAAGVRRRHFAAVREAIAAADGREIKSLGDGLMVAFDSAAAAVACAQVIQRDAAAGGEVGVRVGLHAGEPDREEGDYFGTPVVVASRLCDRAAAGQILASELVRGLAGPREGARFRALGPLVLKGLAEPVNVWTVAWAAGDDAGPAPAAGLRAPLPAGLARAETTFVGRAEPVQRLLDELAAARDGHLRVALLSGEPGIGKSRLAAETARAAHDDGAVVLFGRCDEEALVPYQPFAEAVRAYVATVPAAGALASGLERMTGAAGAAQDSGADPSAERLALFEATTRFFGAVALGGPILLILDDLHWADGPTLALLRHVVRRGGDVPMLVLGTYRDTDLSRTHPLAAMLAELRRERPVERVSLTGLDEDAVAAMLTGAAGHEPPRPFVQALHAETEGNPFFMEEIVRHLVESGAIIQRDGRWTSDLQIDQMGIPEGVREAIGRRLAHLPEAANRALSDASALGRRFEFDVLAEMSGTDEDTLLDALDDALRAQLVVEAAEGGAPAYAFRHALVRETLYEELSLPRRQRLHARAAEAIEAVHARDLDAQAGTLAMHLRLAGAAVDLRRALEWTLRAAGASADQLAWEDATAHLEAALELMELVGVRPEEEAPLLERLADLYYVTNSEIERGLACLERALDLYESAGMTDRAARVHSKIGRDRATYWGPTMDIGRSLEHIHAAEAVLGTDEPTPAVGALNVALATAHIAAMDGHAGRAASRRAVAIGRATGRRLLELNAEALDCYFAATVGELDVLERLEAAWQEADRINHPWLGFLTAWVGAGSAFWLRGPIAQREWLERELASARSATTTGQREVLGNFSAATYIMGGELELGAARLAEHPMGGFLGTQVAVALTLEGPARGLELAVVMHEEAARQENGWTQALADYWRSEALAGGGDFGAAVAALASEVSRFDAAGFRAFADAERGWLAMRHVVNGDVDAARAELERRIVLPDAFTLPIAQWSLAEAAMAAAEGRRDDADAGFANAIERMEAIAFGWRAIEARRAYGVLTGRTEPIDEAIAEYERIGAAPAWAEVARADRDRVLAGAGA